MILKRLPYLPLHFFYFQFPPSVRWLFLGLMGMVVLVSGLFLYVSLFPETWSLAVQEVPQPQAEALSIQTVTHNYLSLDLPLRAYRQWIGYSAGPLKPHRLPVLIFLVVQLIAWSTLLEMGTRVRSRWAYGFFVVFALFIHFTDVVGMLFPDDRYRLLEFLAIACFLAPAYLFQANILRWRWPWRYGLFLGLNALLFGFALAKHGWLGVHKMSVDSFPLLAVVGIAFLFFIAKEPTNLVMVVTNNRKEERNRLGPWLILAIYAGLLLWQLGPFLSLTDLVDFPAEIGLRPIYLIFIAALFTAFTSQNQFHVVRHMLSSLTVYTFLLISWALIAMSFFFLIISEGDHAFTYALERLAAEVFLGVGLMHVFYLYTNHFELLKGRVNLYYVMTQGRKFSFSAVALFGLLAVVFLEGKDNWRSFRLFVHSFAVQHADHDLLSGQRDAAIASYRLALNFSPVSVKANYNLAALLISDPKQVNQALAAYEQAIKWQDDPYARINAANLLLVHQSPQKAVQVLKGASPRVADNAFLANNLGLLYVQQQAPDSAIQQFQRALSHDLDLASAYSNLALLYLDHERPELARQFAQASASVATPSAAALVNALYLHMKLDEALELPEEVIQRSDDPTLQYNHLLSLLKREELDAAHELAHQLSEDATFFDAQLVEAWLMFQRDSIEQAMSRVAYFEGPSAAPAAEAHYILGVAFFGRGVPEMARSYFARAGELGLPRGQLYAAVMDMELGRHDTASVQLSELRVANEALWDACSRELAILLQAHGQELYAQTEWDLQSLSYADRMRISLYADSLNSFIYAENNFRSLLEQYPDSIPPYLAMGRIYNQYQDELALINLETGLQVNASSIPLQLELARAHVYQQNLELASDLLAGIPDSYERARVQAEWTLATGDSTTALAQFEALHQQNLLDQDIILQLNELYQSTNQQQKGYELINQALTFNHQHPQFWYLYGTYTRQWGMMDEARFAFEKALALSQDPRERSRYDDARRKLPENN